MAINIVRYEFEDETRWGVLDKELIYPLSLPCTTTKALLEFGKKTINQSIQSDKTGLRLNEVKLLSPITAPAKVLCQGANYRQHMIDSGMDPDEKKFNMFFTKSTASISDPVGEIIKPKHVSLLDYEVELTLVLAKQTASPVHVTNNNLHEFIAGICIGNDISARDVQIPQMQFHKGKSYRTFCPLGPVLCLLEKNEIHHINNLELLLKVNGHTRQNDFTENLVFKPSETLTELSMIHDFEIGDVVLTGTPSGCALNLPSPFLVRVSSLLPEAMKWKIFLKAQRRRVQYLQEGDLVESTIQSKDKKINLGIQRHTIKGGI